MVRVALGVICHDRPAELAAALGSAAARGFDETVVLDMASDPPLEPAAGVRWLRSDENLGVTAGRNRVLAATGAEVVAFLDDDAVLLAGDAGDVRAAFADDDRLAVVAFRVVRPDGRTVSAEHPFRGPAPESGTAARPCAYFVGCGYAARRAAIDGVGGYDERFFYSTEEVDLSFKLLRDGWRLRYEPALVVEHRPSTRGRSVAPRVPALRLRNRIVAARRHLPAAVGAVHVAAWAGRTLAEAGRAGTLRPWLRAWGEGWREPVDRRPLPWRELRAIHRLGGRVWW